jgi:hypothetical protein
LYDITTKVAKVFAKVAKPLIQKCYAPEFYGIKKPPKKVVECPEQESNLHILANGRF